MTRNLPETIVGAVVLLAAGMFLTMLLSRADLGGAGGETTYSATFLNAEGLSVGTEVRIAGVKVGRVTGQTLNKDTYDAEVSFAIDPKIEVPSDSSIRVLSDGLLGGSFLSIEPGGDEVVLKPGESITYTSDAVNLLDLISKAIFSAADS